MKKSNKHIRSASNHSARNRSVFVPLSAGFCATALAITGGVAANASAASSAVASSSVASSSSVVKSSTAKVAKKASSVTGGGQASEHSAVPTAPAHIISKDKAEQMAGCEAEIKGHRAARYIVIKPKGNATKGIISADLKPKDFEAIRDKIRSDESSDVTLKFEGQIYGYGSIKELFAESGIKSLGNIGDFDVSNVTDMSSIFYRCKRLESLNGLEKWNTGKVRNMSQMFLRCERLESLNGLEKWNTSNVTNMLQMFWYCKSIKSLDGLKSWNTSHVADMSGMFLHCERLESLNGLEKWNTSNVQKMFQMFSYCRSIKSLDGLESWNTGNVKYMSQMFIHCDNLTDISAVQSWTFNKNRHLIYIVTAMFRDCGKLSNISPIESWANIFYKKSERYYGPYFMFSRRSSGDSPITLTANWFKQNHTDIFSIFARGAVFIFNEGNKIDSSIINKFNSDENIAELLERNIIITDNANLVDAMKDKKADEDDSHLVTVQYGDASEKTHIPSVLDSRINGKASTDVVEIVKHYIPAAVEDGAKTLRSKNAGVPTDYIAIASRELSSTSKLSDLFQTYTIKEAHTVTFMDDKSTVTTVKVEAGGKIADLANETIVTSDAVLTGVTMPDAPAKDGYTFNGWNTKADGTGDAFTKDSVVDTDKVVYAQYTKNEVHNPTQNPQPNPPEPSPEPSPTPDPTPNPAPQPGGGNPGGGLNPDGGGSGDKPGNNPNNNPGNGNNTNGSGDGTGNGNTKNDGDGNGGNNTNGNNTNGSNANRNRNGGSAGGNGLNAGGSGSNSSNSAKSNDSDSAKDSAEDHSDSSDSAKDSAKDSDKDSKDSAKSSASSSAKSASSSSNIGLIASIIGALAAIAAIVGGFFFFVLFGKKRKKRKDEDEN